MHRLYSTHFTVIVSRGRTKGDFYVLLCALLYIPNFSHESASLLEASPVFTLTLDSWSFLMLSEELKVSVQDPEMLTYSQMSELPSSYHFTLPPRK